MGGDERRRMLRYALLAGAVFTIGLGVYLVSATGAVGWAVVAFGVLDLLTVPL